MTPAALTMAVRRVEADPRTRTSGSGLIARGTQPAGSHRLTGSCSGPMSESAPKKAYTPPSAVVGGILGVATAAAYLIGSGRAFGYDAAVTFANLLATPC